MLQTEAVRPHLFNVRFSEEEQARLERLCAHLGLTAANLIRMMLLEKERALGLPPASPPSRPRTKPRKR
jgi:antitoxin component of RelBE/YafQ-DinJ toxin-antitoxin module